MRLPYEWQVGWRYVRAGGGGFVSFITMASMAGIALGVAALIVVMSVMNGFATEVRDRMLDAIAHIDVIQRGGGAIDELPALQQTLRAHPEVRASAPFTAQPALLVRDDTLQGVLVRGIDPALEPAVMPLVQALPAETLARLQPGSRAMLIGRELARSLGVQVGQPITLLRPAATAGGAPRFVAFTVAGIFEAGHYEFDSGLAMVHLQDALQAFDLAGPTAVQMRLADRFRAPQVAAELAQQLGPGYLVREWTRSNRNWFDSVQIQKRLIAIILTLIVAVAAFNLVATLVMTVTDKRAQVAILRTLGASPGSIMAIFVVQGATAGLIGTASGVALGLAIAFNIDVIVPAIEHALGTAFLPANIYLITKMPSLPLASDVVPVAGVSLLLSLLATLYPSWRASRVQPAQALRYE